MSQHDLKQALGRLQGELAKQPFRDPVAQAEVAQLVREIEQAAAGMHDKPGHDGLQLRLGAAVRKFEVEHPVFTGCLGQVISALSNMGI